MLAEAGPLVAAGLGPPITKGRRDPPRARQDEGRVELAADGQQRRGNNSRAARRVHPAGGLKEVPVRQSAYQAGYRAYNLGLGRCPHSRGSFLSQSWWGGWWDAQRAERAAERNQLRPASPGRRTTPCSACEEAKIFAKKRPPKKGPARVGGRQVRAQQRGGEGRAPLTGEERSAPTGLASGRRSEIELAAPERGVQAPGLSGGG